MISVMNMIWYWMGWKRMWVFRSWVMGISK